MTIDEKIKMHEKCIECLKKQKENSLWENSHAIWKKNDYSEYLKIKKVIDTNSSQINIICDRLIIYKDKFEFTHNRNCTYNKFYFKFISKVAYDEKIQQMINLMQNDCKN